MEIFFVVHRIIAFFICIIGFRRACGFHFAVWRLCRSLSGSIFWLADYLKVVKFYFESVLNTSDALLVDNNIVIVVLRLNFNSDRVTNSSCWFNLNLMHAEFLYNICIIVSFSFMKHIQIMIDLVIKLYEFMLMQRKI